MTILSNYDKLLLRRHLRRAKGQYMLQVSQLTEEKGTGDSVSNTVVSRYLVAVAECQDFINRLTEIDPKEEVK